MVEMIQHGVYLLDGKTIVDNPEGLPGKDEARENTIAYGILRSHDVQGTNGTKLKIRFDAMASHDITYVGIIQTARASGLEKFPIPYAMTTVVSMFLPTRRLSTSMSVRPLPPVAVWFSVLTPTPAMDPLDAWVSVKVAVSL